MIVLFTDKDKRWMSSEHVMRDQIVVTHQIALRQTISCCRRSVPDEGQHAVSALAVGIVQSPLSNMTS